MPTYVCRLCYPPVRVHVDAPYDSPLAVRQANDRHGDRTHGHLAGVELAGPGQDWFTRALTEAKRLADTGQEFTVDQIAAAAGEPLNPKSDWGVFAKSMRHLGIAEPIPGRGVPSGRESVRGSMVKVWRRQAAA